MGPASQSYALGYWSDAGISFVVDLSEADFERYAKANRKIRRLRHGFSVRHVERNYQDLRNLFKFVGIVMSLGRTFAIVDPGDVTDSLAGQVVNWLASVRLFLDHAETDLKHRFGDPSAQVAAFDKATSAAYDGTFGYRFIYKFRNFVQHCGLPISKVVAEEADGTGSPLAVQKVTFLVDRDYLLSSYDGWGVVAHELRSMPDQIPLEPLVVEAMDQVGVVARALQDIDIQDAASSASDLVEALDRLAVTRGAGTPNLFSILRSDGASTMNLTPDPITPDLVHKLVDIANGSAMPADLLARPELPSIPLDPATVRSRFHRDSRGVQTMSAFLAQGGTGGPFWSSVNDMIAADGGITPLIDGLVNMSALLLLMTAGALGAQPAGLLAGLLDHYGGYDVQPDPTHADDHERCDDGHDPEPRG